MNYVNRSKQQSIARAGRPEKASLPRDSTKHPPRRCPAYRFRCTKCLFRGHYTNLFKTRINIGNEEPEEGQETDIFIGQVKTEEIQEVKISKGCRWMYPLKVGNSTLHVQLDTGAGANLLNENDYHGITPRPKLTSTNIHLTGYTDDEIKVKGACLVKIEVAGKSSFVRFIVVENGTSLLGATSCEKLGLVNTILAVREESDEVTVKDVGQCTLPEVKDKLSSLPFVYSIETKDDAVPIIKAARRVPVALREPLKRELERMENLGVIHKQDEPCEWVS